ncbi:MAG: type I methionyl aminopeptidase [Minisyncoccia bacterium]
MVKIKTEKEIEILKEGGRRLSCILDELEKMVRPGITTKDLDIACEKMMKEQEGIAVLKGYQPYGADIPFPAALCTSVNSVVVHGVPNDYVLKEGDIVGLDTCFEYQGMITDSARTVAVGKISKEDKKLMEVTKQAMFAGIDMAKVGKTTHDIGKAVEKVLNEHGYGTPTILGGHGVGYGVHEDPYVPNYDMGKGGVKLVPGMVITVEPMLILGGTDDVYTDGKDGYSVYTKDGSKSAHFEHTIVIRENGAEILT